MNLVELGEVEDLGLPWGALEVARAIEVSKDANNDHPARLTLCIRCVVRPTAGPYAGATIPLRLLFSPAYPWEGPRIICARRLWHPSVDPHSGALCLNILRLGWKPVLGLSTLLLGLWLVLQVEDTDNEPPIPGQTSNAKDDPLPPRQGNACRWHSDATATTTADNPKQDPLSGAVAATSTAQAPIAAHEEDALNGEAAQMLRRDPKQFSIIVALTLRGGTYGGITYENCMEEGRLHECRV